MITDRYASVVDLQNRKHWETLHQMLQDPSPYLLWITLVPSRQALEKRLAREYGEELRRFIAERTHWNIGSGKRIQPVFQVTFGEVFLLLKYGSRQIKVGLNEIEKS